MLLLHDGQEYTTLKGDKYQKGVLFGESNGRKWLKVILADKKGMCRVTGFVANEDHGLSPEDDVVTVKVDTFNVSSDNPKDGIKVSPYQAKNGQWYLQVVVPSIVLHKIADSYDGGFETEDFSNRQFTVVDTNDQLPF